LHPAAGPPDLDGTMMYTTFATIFIAQAYGIDMPLGTQIAMLFLLMVTSKGMAGIPDHVRGVSRARPAAVTLRCAARAGRMSSGARQ
jgi:Na+/H+-dicarboxylate symporter